MADLPIISTAVQSCHAGLASAAPSVMFSPAPAGPCPCLVGGRYDDGKLDQTAIDVPNEDPRLLAAKSTSMRQRLGDAQRISCVSRTGTDLPGSPVHLPDFAP